MLFQTPSPRSCGPEARSLIRALFRPINTRLLKTQIEGWIKLGMAPMSSCAFRPLTYIGIEFALQTDADVED
jgi:hypothetical protein